MSDRSSTEQLPPESAPSSRRLHDLDALRGFAMLLGIVLHALLAFLPAFWPAQDRTAGWGGPYDEILHAIHGFRMPLFFLLSGFFTTMLWRRRGLQSLLWHRFRRIALPLALGMVTIVPAVNWASEWATGNSVSDYVEESGDIWAATYLGEEGLVEGLLERGYDVNVPNPQDGNTPLHIAAIVDSAEIAELLLGKGADPNRAANDGTPIEFAVFFGSEEVAELLVAAGAPDLRPPGGDWEDVSFWNAGEGLLEAAGEDLGISTWLASFHHLWFLWFLIWLVGGFAVIATLVDRFGTAADIPTRWSGIAMWSLIPIVLLPQLAMGEWGASPAFGPDTSTGLLPEPHVLAYYACFFAFGALLYGRKDASGKPLVETIGRWWMVVLPVAITVLLPSGLHVTFTVDGLWWLASIIQVAYAWAMTFGLMGMFRTLLSNERRGVRYLSDSSYWLYLAHVPLLIITQSAIRNWNLPSGVKFIGLTVIVTLVLLGTYQLFVRYTPLGTLLNGKRVRPGR